MDVREDRKTYDCQAFNNKKILLVSFPQLLLLLLLFVCQNFYFFFYRFITYANALTQNTAKNKQKELKEKENIC